MDPPSPGDQAPNCDAAHQTKARTCPESGEGPAPSDSQWRALAALMLAVFASDLVMLTQALVLGEGLNRALYHFLVGHYPDAR